MADWKNIGNYAELALFAGSLALWVRILVKRIFGQPPLGLVERQPVSWEPAPLGATFLVAFYLPLFLFRLSPWLVGPIDPQSLGAVQWSSAFAITQIVAIVALLRLAGPLRKEDFGLNLSRWRSDILVGAGGFLASFIPVYLVTVLQQFLNWRGPDDKHVFFKILEASEGNGAVLWIVGAVVIVAPLAEELLYRVLLQGFIQSQLAPWMAISFSTAIFCFVHGQSDILPLVPLALILGYIYYRRRSYLALVVAHGLFNAMNITLALMRS
jgi:membrane protease YdiL (CAAX protease family)